MLVPGTRLERFFCRDFALKDFKYWLRRARVLSEKNHSQGVDNFDFFRQCCRWSDETPAGEVTCLSTEICRWS